jgi:hypothetical protein
MNDTQDVACTDGTCDAMDVVPYEVNSGYGGLDAALGLPNPAEMLSLTELISEMDDEGQFMWEVIKQYEEKYGMEKLLTTTAWFSQTKERSTYYELEVEGPEAFANPLTRSGAYYNDGTNLSTREGDRKAGFAGNHFNWFRTIYKDEMKMHFKHVVPLAQLKGQEAKVAETLNMAIEMDQDFQGTVSVVAKSLDVALTAASIITGTIALKGATTLIAKGAYFLLVTFETAHGATYLPGSGKNPLEEAIAYLGNVAEPKNGEEIARTMFHMINFSVGLKGKYAAIAASIPLVAGTGGHNTDKEWEYEEEGSQ